MTITHTSTAATPRLRPLTSEQLDGFRRDAAADDEANRFFANTHDELVAGGHYVGNVPTSLGGGGLDLLATGRRQRHLARYAPAPALASSMHLYWTGAAADLAALGIDDLRFVLTDAAAGQIFASGHAEAGNDIPVLLSTTLAEPVPGGYRITGRKHFGSLGPVWDQLGFHAMDLSDPNNPMVVHGFARRGDQGVTVDENWDTMTMRASQSYDTAFDRAFVPADRIGAVVPAGSVESPVTGTMTVWAISLICNVYIGVAERAFDLAVSSAQSKTSIALDGRTMAHNPMIQHQIAAMWIDLESMRSSLDMIATDWCNGVDHGLQWGPKVFAAKERTSQLVRSVVDTAMDVAGGSSIGRKGELSRLWRDSRGVSYHPATHAFAHEAIAKSALGVDPAGPRW